MITESFPGHNGPRSQLRVRSVTPLENGISLAMDQDVKRLLFVALTCLIGGSAFASDLRLEVDLSKRSLSAIVGRETVDTFDVAVGTEEKPTPRGDFKIRKVVFNPAWAPPDEKWARGKTAKPPGHPDNPMKRVKMFFQEPDYYIHGTGDEDSLGKAESHGCIRMSPDDVTRLARLVMDHGGKPMPEPWYRRIFRAKTTKVVYLTDPVAVPAPLLRAATSRSGGPGGQNVNKVETRVTIEVDVAALPLDEAQKTRVREALAGRISRAGVLRVTSQAERSQVANRERALTRMEELLRDALEERVPRKATRVSKAQKQRRVEEKKRRSETKRLRGRVD
jgi:hypothetical protein